MGLDGKEATLSHDFHFHHTPFLLPRNRDGSGTREGFDADAVGSVDFTLEYANIAAQDAINNELSFVIPDIFETTVISVSLCIALQLLTLSGLVPRPK